MGKTIFESAKKIPVYAETEVLVVGGGPAGIAAAIASVRQGAETMIIERYGCFGGVITHVGIEAVAWYRHEGVNEAGGLLLEIEDRAMKAQASVKECQSESQALDTEMFKYVCDDLLLESKVRPMLHTFAADVIMEDSMIKGIICQSKSGRFAVLAQTIIDCTGDADIVFLAGAPFYQAKREDLMAVTQLFSCCGVDVDKFLNYVTNELKPTYRDWAGKSWTQNFLGKGVDMFSPYLEKPFAEALKTGELTIEDKHITIGGTWGTITPEGEVMQLNLVFMRNIDCTNVSDLTKAEMSGRKYCLKALRILKQKVPGFSNARLRNFGMTLGTRESRLIKGLYTLTKEDIFGQARFEDSIAIFPEFIDGRGYLVLPLTGRYYQIPFRALVPRGVENLLVAGRCISGEPMAHTSFRNMACCIATGQAAGTAAAVSVRSGKPLSAVNIPKIQEELVKQGVRIA
jgi:hypothetical protein